ncbi:hypothetical protein [Arthrobacter sp. 31Y]|uniref:hypothetical protein n=1 Tax=Arthrobacter sp. 31Y TaxID=1115632 RepID=UPI0004640217|nr:hypothetical protein [Arthrobacter sp. 31Y]
MSEQNQHFEQAKSRLRNGTPNEVARAQAEATLALAHEQRTTNLIALLDAGHSTAQIAGVDYEAVADQIKERLGL